LKNRQRAIRDPFGVSERGHEGEVCARRRLINLPLGQKVTETHRGRRSDRRSARTNGSRSVWRVGERRGRLGVLGEKKEERKKPHKKTKTREPEKEGGQETRMRSNAERRNCVGRLLSLIHLTESGTGQVHREPRLRSAPAHISNGGLILEQNQRRASCRLSTGSHVRSLQHRIGSGRRPLGSPLPFPLSRLPFPQPAPPQFQSNTPP